MAGFENGAGPQTLRNLAQQTGGKYLSAPNTGSVGTAYAAIDAQLNNEYLLTFPYSTACGPQTIAISVQGQTPVNGTFERCTPRYFPDLIGMTRSEAITEIMAFGLTLDTETQQSSATVPSGSVITQNPLPGVLINESGSKDIDIVVSSGPAPAVVPAVVGLTQSAATTAITGAQLVVGTVTLQASATVASGIVISQTPAAATAGIFQGAAVDLVVSSGPAPSGGGGTGGGGTPTSGGGGGGGGALGLLELIGALGLVALGRRRRVTDRVTSAR